MCTDHHYDPCTLICCGLPKKLFRKILFNLSEFSSFLQSFIQNSKTLNLIYRTLKNLQSHPSNRIFR
jgi:hypothetical protein